MFKQLCPSAICKKPSQTHGHFVLTTYLYSSALFKETHRMSQRNDTFNAQFPKLTSIPYKFSHVEGHVTKYCCYVMLDRIVPVAKYSRTCIRESGQLDCFRHGQRSRVPRN